MKNSNAIALCIVVSALAAIPVSMFTAAKLIEANNAEIKVKNDDFPSVIERSVREAEYLDLRDRRMELHCQDKGGIRSNQAFPMSNLVATTCVDEDSHPLLQDLFLKEDK